MENMRLITERKVKSGIKRNRILFDAPYELHKEIKMRALARNISMGTWLLRAVVKALKQEKHYD